MTTPFSTTPAAYPGARPVRLPKWDVRAKRAWLGVPGNMIELPPVDPSNYDAPPSLGEVEHGLVNGGSSVDRFASAMRRWSLSWDRLAGRDRDVLWGFYRRLFGPEPYCWVPMEDTNRLTLGQSMCGNLNGVVEGWSVTAGNTLAYDSTLTPAIYPSGVMRWTPASGGGYLTTGDIVSTVITPDGDYAAPYLPAEPCSFSAWMKAETTATSVTVRLSGRKADGTETAGATSPTITVPADAPALVQFAIDPGVLLASQYVIPIIGTGAAASILVSAAQLEYRVFRTDWRPGAGVPRVVIPAPIGRTPDIHANLASTLTLAECIAGAA